jgi:hypothetical protein
MNRTRVKHRGTLREQDMADILSRVGECTTEEGGGETVDEEGGIWGLGRGDRGPETTPARERGVLTPSHPTMIAYLPYQSQNQSRPLTLAVACAFRITHNAINRVEPWHGPSCLANSTWFDHATRLDTASQLGPDVRRSTCGIACADIRSVCRSTSRHSCSTTPLTTQCALNPFPLGELPEPLTQSLSTPTWRLVGEAASDDDLRGSGL